MGSYRVWNSNGDSKLIENVTIVRLEDWEDDDYTTSTLVKVKLNTGIISIENNTFEACDSLTNIVFNNEIEEIGQYAFSGCLCLQDVTIPNSVTTLSSFAFENCDSIQSIIIGNSVTQIGAYTFQNCTSLKLLEIGSGVEQISACAFLGCSALEQIIIPENVKKITAYAFSACDSLKTVIIKNEAIELYSSVFNSCKSLETLIFFGTGNQWSGVKNKWGLSFTSEPTIICCLDGDELDTLFDPESGSIKFKIELTDKYIKKIERSNIQTDFFGEDIEKIYTIYQVSGNSNGETVFYDYTCETGINYTYWIWYGEENDNNEQNNSWICGIVKNVQIDYEDIILFDKTNIPYRVRYNPTVSGLKKNLQESTTITLGGRYPVVRRNGDSNYYTFTFGGLLSWQQENEDMYDSDMTIIDRNRVERAWRKISVDFLSNGEVKLFKSPQEGLMLIRVTGVSLTPETKLGRNIYSFTATATEVAECTPENFSRYGIYTSATPDLWVFNTQTQAFLVRKSKDE